MGRHLLPVSIAAAVLVMAAAGAAQTPQGMTVYSLATSPAAPDTVYAGTSDGVYRSTDFGKSWRRSSNGLPDGGAVVAVDPKNAQRVYAWADGLRVSLDGGRHWQLPAKRPKEMFGVIQIAVAPSAPKTLYTLTGGWGTPALWRSTSAGRSWVRVADASGGETLDIATDPLSANRLYLGVLWSEAYNNGGGVLVSTDGGRTWRRRVSTPAMSFGIHSLAVDPASATVYAGGGQGEIYRSADRGEHWRAVARLDVRDRVAALAVDPTEPDVVFALTLEGVHRSTDRGVSWRLVGRPSFGRMRVTNWASHFATMIVHPRDSDRILLSAGGSRVWRSSDRGRSWTATSLADGTRAAQLDGAS